MNKQAVLSGLVAGLAGVAAMTAAETLEQAVTRRPNSSVPAHTRERLLRLPTSRTPGAGVSTGRCTGVKVSCLG
jgi:hypothetical protein